MVYSRRLLAGHTYRVVCDSESCGDDACGGTDETADFGGAEAHEPESDDRGDERDHVDDGAHRVIEYGSVRRGRMVGNVVRAGFRGFFELGVRRVVGHVLLRSLMG